MKDNERFDIRRRLDRLEERQSAIIQSVAMAQMTLATLPPVDREKAIGRVKEIISVWGKFMSVEEAGFVSGVGEAAVGAISQQGVRLP